MTQESRAREVLSHYLDLSEGEYTEAELELIREAMVAYAEESLDEAFREIGAVVESSYLKTQNNLK